MNDYEPGEAAPASALYYQVDHDGRPMVATALMTRGDRLPAAPEGYRWRRMVPPEDDSRRWWVTARGAVSPTNAAC